MPLAGNLRQASLLHILRTIALEQRDGCLTLTRGHLRAEIYFRRGQWLAAERVPVGPPLTEQFVAMGYMSPEQIEEVILVPFDEAAVLPDGQIVQALMADGLLTREQLHYWAMSDAIALVNVVAGWPDGDFSFVDGIHPPQELVLVPMPIENIMASLGSVEQPPAAQHTGQNPASIALPRARYSSAAITTTPATSKRIFFSPGRINKPPQKRRGKRNMLSRLALVSQLLGE